MKKILLVMMISCPITASAYDAYIDGIFYNLDPKGSKATVTVTESSYDPDHEWYRGNVIIPSSIVVDDKSYTVTQIGDGAFSGCSELESVTIPETVSYIFSNAFQDCKGLKSISVDPGNEYFTMSDGAMYDKNLTTLHFCLPTVTDIVIPNTVTTIASDAFVNNRKVLKSVKLSNSLTSIKNWTFQGCSVLTSIVIPKSVTYIGDFAFYGCNRLSIYVLGTSLDYSDSMFGIRIAESGQKPVTSVNTVVYRWKNSDLEEIHTDLECKTEYLDTLFISDVDSMLKKVSFKVRNPFPEYDLKVLEVKSNKDEVVSADADGKYNLEPAIVGGGVRGTIRLLIDEDECICEYRIKAESPDYKVKCEKHQTYLLFSDLSAPSDETATPTKVSLVFIEDRYHPMETKEFTADDEGKIKIENLQIKEEYSYYIKAVYDGLEVDGERVYVSTLGLNPMFSVIEATPTTIYIKCSKYLDDATLDSEYILFGGEYYEGNSLYLTELTPDSIYDVRYYVDPKEEGFSGKCSTEIRTKPLEISVLNPQPVSSTCAIVAAETNISEDETNVGFQWRKYDAPETLPSSEGYAAIYDGRLEGYIKNLQATSYYNVRAFYKAANGNYYYSDWITFDPSDFSYFEPTVHTYPIDEITESTAKVKGYVLAGTDEITAQGFEYWPLGENVVEAKAVSASTRVGEDVSVIMGTGQVMTAELINLAPGTTYCCRAFVTTISGTTYGEEQTFTTQGNATGVNTVVAEKAEPVIVGYYDLCGRKLNGSQRGVNIVRYSDGTAKKVFVK